MIFNPNNNITAFLSGIVDVIETLILTVVCCIPVFTIGASLCAMHKTMMDIVLKRSSSTHKTFFASFKENFRLSTLLWALFLVFGILLYVNLNICLSYNGPQSAVHKVMWGIVVVCICIWLAVATYAFAFVAKFKVTFSQALKNAVFIGIGKFHWTVLILILKFVCFFSIWFLYFYALPVVCICMYLENRILIIAMLGHKALKEDNKGEIYYE